MLGDGFELQEGREHDVHVGFAARRLMDLGNCLGGENGHGNGLCDCSFSVKLEMVISIPTRRLGEFILLLLFWIGKV